MVRARFLVIAELLALLAFVPSALGDCGFNHDGSNTSPPTFAAQTVPTPPSPVAIAALVLVPIGLTAGVVALARRVSPKAASGRWVATPTQWMWVEDRK